MRKTVVSTFLLFIVGCAPSTVEDCQSEAKGVVKSLISDLKKIQTRDDLMKEGSKIEQKVQALVTLIIRIKKFQENGGVRIEEEGSMLSDLLMHEMERIYLLEGGRELMESFQREGLLKLDAFYQKGKKTF